MTIDPKTREKLEELYRAYGANRGNDNAVAINSIRGAELALLSAVRTAHLQELGETEDFEKAALSLSGLHPAMWEDQMTQEAKDWWRQEVKRIAPFLTAPLRAKLQAQEARIKELEERGHCPDCQRSHP